MTEKTKDDPYAMYRQYTDPRCQAVPTEDLRSPRETLERRLKHHLELADTYCRQIKEAQEHLDGQNLMVAEFRRALRELG